MLKFKKMGTDKIPILLITANVGSIFESPNVMLPVWTAEFLQTVSKMEPKFIALHLQEVGGKTYEKSMQYVQDFIQRLCDSPELRLFDKVRIFLDEDFSSAEKFTALGNMYFVHSSLSDVKIWDFDRKCYVQAEGKEVHTGNIEKVPTKEKAKFPQHFFPECKWSRKGFLRTRWHLRGTAVDLVNIHLFHDASNVLAMETFPSVYCRSRRRALRHTLRHLHSDVNSAPYFIFGDFNFRTDTGGVVKKLTEDLTTCRIHNTAKSPDHTKYQYKNERDDRIVLTVGKKEFTHQEHQKIFKEQWLQKYDRELDALKPHLYEFPIKFPPSYPFEENVELPTHYMKTRCPAWCDRILLSQTARLLLQQPDSSRGSQAELRNLQASRKSTAESTDSPSRCSVASSNHTSSSENSPARSNSPAMASNNMASPAKKSGLTEWEGLLVPGINVARKSIADPTNIQNALNARTDSAESSPTRRRLVRNQSEGSPKPTDQSELRRLMDNSNNPSLRKRIEYGIIGETICMGDHKPVYLRVLLQSDRGRLNCCTMPDKENYCYGSSKMELSDVCTKCLSLHSLIKTDSKECFEPIHLKSLLNRAPCNQSFDSVDFADCRTSGLVRLGTDPNLPEIARDPKLSVFENLRQRHDSEKTSHSSNNCLNYPKINITDADYISYEHLFVNNIDTQLLYTANTFQDPYTPESIDSHSPNPEPESMSSSNIGSRRTSSAKVDTEGKSIEDMLRSKLIKTRSVSPRQLKSRLENIINGRGNVDSRDANLTTEFNSNESSLNKGVVHRFKSTVHNVSHDGSRKASSEEKNVLDCFKCKIS